MTQQPLDSSLIANPRLYNLILRIEPLRLDVMIYSGGEDDDSLIYRSIKLDSAPSQIAALEEAVYENPVLLGDFNRITVILASTDYAIVPEWVADDDSLETAVADKLIVNDDADTELLTVNIPESGVAQTRSETSRIPEAHIQQSRHTSPCRAIDKIFPQHREARRGRQDIRQSQK